MDRKFNTKIELIDYLRSASPDDLSYILGRYCGPHNKILAEKQFGSYAKDLLRLVNSELANRQFEEMLFTDT